MPPPKTPAPKSLATDPLVHSLVRWLLIIVFVVIGWTVITYLTAILAPIMAALGIAYMIDPVVERMVARGMSRGVAATLMLLAFLGILIGGLVLLIPATIHQVQLFADDVPGMIDRADAWIKSRSSFDLKSHLDAGELQAMVENSFGSFEHIAEVAVGGAFTILGFLGEMLLVPVFAYYFLVDWPHIQSRIIRFIPPRRRNRVKDLLGEVDAVVAGWVRGQAIVTSVLAVLYAVAFWIIGVPLAVPLGFVVGALTIIPFIGTFVGAGITTLVLLLNWPGGGVVAAVGGTFLVLHGLEAFILTPKIVGHKVGLSESAALFAVVAGGKLLGFVGILLAVPIAASIAVLLRHTVRYYEGTEFFGDEADAIVPVTPGMALMMPVEDVDGTATTDELAGEAGGAVDLTTPPPVKDDEQP